MNDIITAPTMSSREIAELTGKRHDNVKRTIESLIERDVIASPQIEEKPTAGRTATEYVFSGEQGKRDSIVVVAQLSPEFTAALVDRWQELEDQQAQASGRGVLLQWGLVWMTTESKGVTAMQVLNMAGHWQLYRPRRVARFVSKQLRNWCMAHGTMVAHDRIDDSVLIFFRPAAECWLDAGGRRLIGHFIEEQRCKYLERSGLDWPDLPPRAQGDDEEGNVE